MSGLERRKHGIVITGSVGAGKTTTMWALIDVLRAHEHACAGIDMDALRAYYPKPEDDPFGNRLGRKNLAFVTATFLDAGSEYIVLADVVESLADRDALAAAMHDPDLLVVRLHVPREQLRNRLHERELPHNLPWYLNRADELEEILNANAIGDLIVEVNDQAAHAVAHEIATRLGLIG